MSTAVLAAARRGDPLALVAAPGDAFTIVSGTGAADVSADEIGRIEATIGPRWVWWSAPSVATVLTTVAVAAVRRR